MSKSTTPNIISKNENVKNFFEKYNETKGETERKELANVFLYSEGFEVTEDMIKDLWESMKESKKKFEEATSKKEKLKYKKEFECYFALSKELDLVHKLTDQEIKELKEDQETINNAVRDFKNIKPEDLKSPISRKMFFELQIDGETDLLNATNSKIEDLLSLWTTELIIDENEVDETDENKNVENNNTEKKWESKTPETDKNEDKSEKKTEKKEEWKKERRESNKESEKEKLRKAHISLEEKLNYQHRHPGSSIELTDKYEIIERLNTLEVGDRITFKDGYSITITGKKHGKYQIRFDGTPSLSAEWHKGEAWWNLNELLKISNTTIDDIRQLNIPFNLGKKPKKTKTEWTGTTTGPTEGPTGPTEGPTEGPTGPTEGPTGPTEGPNGPTEGPTGPTEGPTGPTDGPNGPTEGPTGPTEGPTEPTEGPTGPTEGPTEPTEGPTGPTEGPTGPTEGPTGPTEGPTGPTDGPNGPTDGPNGPTDEPTDDQEGKYAFKINSVISDTKSVHEEEARLIAEETLRSDYAKVSKWNVFKRWQYFLQRGKMRKKLIKDYLENASKSAFGDNVENAADRHSREKGLKLWEINTVTTLTSIKEINELAIKFIKWEVTEAEFKTEFDNICANNTQLKDSLKDIEYKGTNILQNLKYEKEQYELVNELARDLENWTNLGAITSKIENFITKYQQSPDFLKNIQGNLDKKALDKLKKYFKHQAAIRKSALKNLEIKLDILNKGKWAYEIDNSDREKGWIQSLGKKLDKIPWYLQVPGYAWVGILLWLAWWPLWLWVVGTSVLTTTAFATTSGFTNFVKKWTHYTKEQNTHEKNLTRDYDNEQIQIAQWQQDLTKKWAKNWWKRYKARRQLELYSESTQKNIIKTKDVSNDILNISTSLRPLSSADEKMLRSLLLLGKTRLDAYHKTGHNFLASNSAADIEKDMNGLHRALMLWAEKLWIKFEDIDKIQITAKWATIGYDDMMNELFEDYNNSTKRFRSERRWLAGKYWVWHFALSAGTAVALQYIMWTGIFAKETTTQWVDVNKSAEWSDNFWLGKYSLWEGNNIQTTVSDQLWGLWDKAEVIWHYWAWTDATLLKAGSILNDPTHYNNHIESVIDQIKNLWLTPDQKDVFIKQLTERPWEADWAKAFTNDFLQWDRCADWILQIAKWLEASHSEIVPQLIYDGGQSVAWTTLHNVWERVFSVWLEITDKVGQEVAGSGTTWYVPIVSFANTFKKRPKIEDQQKVKDDTPNKPKDTTDKKWDQPRKRADIPVDHPTPADPKDPDGWHKDDYPKRKDIWKKYWEIKKKVTRWQKVWVIDSEDLWTEYPGKWKMPSERDAAKWILKNWEKANDLGKKALLNEEDNKQLQQLDWNESAQLKYLEEQIKKDREAVKKSEEKEAFDHVLKEIYKRMPKYLADIFWEKDASFLNALPTPERIHLVSDRDYVNIAWDGSSIWVFRSVNWDIYVGKSFLEKYGKWEIAKQYPTLLFHLKHILIHEMIHSMSVLNYSDTEKTGKKESDFLPRRVWLRRLKFDKKTGTFLSDDGVGLNEASTETLTWEILERWYKEEGLDLKTTKVKESYLSYWDYVEVLNLIEKTDKGIEKKDFWKAMLIRKRAKEEHVEVDTPLYGLISKINWADKEWNKIERPSYYTIIMNILDFKNTHESIYLGSFNVSFLKEFIKTKDINYIKKAIPADKMKDVFSKTILNSEGTDFKKEILDAYNKPLRRDKHLVK